MKVFVNDKELLFDAKISVFQMLSFLKINDLKGIAIALNNEVVPKARWEKHFLNEGDHVVLITAAQGG